MDKQVLLLNNSEEILSLVDWRKAVQLLCSQKATAPFDYQDNYEILTSSGKMYQLPTAIILNSYANVPFKVAALSRRNIMKRDSHECQYCAKKLHGINETIDHVFPTSRGGKNEWKNVVAACKACNSKKADRTPEEANMRLLKKPIIPTRLNLIFRSIHKNRRPSWNRWLKD